MIISRFCIWLYRVSKAICEEWLFCGMMLLFSGSQTFWWCYLSSIHKILFYLQICHDARGHLGHRRHWGHRGHPGHRGHCGYCGYCGHRRHQDSTLRTLRKSRTSVLHLLYWGHLYCCADILKVILPFFGKYTYGLGTTALIHKIATAAAAITNKDVNLSYFSKIVLHKNTI